MNVSELYEKYPYQHWLDYDPWDPHYANFKPYYIYTAFKIVDVYSSFAHARSYLNELDIDNYGQLISKHDDVHLKYIRAKIIQSALAFYNYCIDLSWQVVWFNISDDTFRFIKDNAYDDYANECDFDTLILKLKMFKKEYLKRHIIKFRTNEITEYIRKRYNYLKHRGTFQFDGLGVPQRNSIGSVNGISLPFLRREEIDIDELKNKLIEFDILFVNYFNILIEMTMPSNFTQVQLDLYAPLSIYKKFKRDGIIG